VLRDVLGDADDQAHAGGCDLDNRLLFACL
jgi:hypothetical protein